MKNAIPTFVICFTLSGMFYILLVAHYGKFDLHRKLKNSIKRVKNFWKIKKCRATNHKNGAWRLIERTPLVNPDIPTAQHHNQIFKLVNNKYCCENCGTTFIEIDKLEGTWI